MTVNQCYQAGLNRQRGFSLFEIVVVVLLIGVLMSIAIDRLLQLQIAAERVSVQYVIGTLDSAIYLQTAENVIKHGMVSLRKMEHTNPMDYLAKLPQNYLGEKSGEATRQVPVSNWYFDPVKNLLVYKVENTKYFESNIEGEPQIQLKLSLVYRDDIGDNRSSNIQGVRLRSLYDYNWKTIEE